MESEKITGKDVPGDRRKVRDGLAKLKTTPGLMGITKRTDDREADKPYLFVTAKGNDWVVLYDPL
jgi:branched-chain amino acid transport system substrate-binding protein